MFQMILLLMSVGGRNAPLTSEYSQNEELELLSNDTKMKLQVYNGESIKLFFQEITEYFEGTLFFDILNFPNMDSQQKRIIFASGLSIILLFIFCLMMSYISQKSKQSMHQLNMENNPIGVNYQNI